MNTSSFKAEAEALARGVQTPRIPAAEYRLAPENYSDIHTLLNSALKKCAGSGGGSSMS